MTLLALSLSLLGSGYAFYLLLRNVNKGEELRERNVRWSMKLYGLDREN